MLIALRMLVLRAIPPANLPRLFGGRSRCVMQAEVRQPRVTCARRSCHLSLHKRDSTSVESGLSYSILHLHYHIQHLCKSSFHFVKSSLTCWNIYRLLASALHNYLIRIFDVIPSSSLGSLYHHTPLSPPRPDNNLSPTRKQKKPSNFIFLSVHTAWYTIYSTPSPHTTLCSHSPSTRFHY